MANLVSVIRARLVHFERAVVQLNLVSADLKYTPLYRLLSSYEHREGELLSVREIVNNSQNDKELEQSRLRVDNCAVPSPSWGYLVGPACYAGFRCVHGCSWEDYSKMEKVR